MMDYSQGDIIKISGFTGRQFVIVSKNAFLRATGVFHVCPLVKGVSSGPLHIAVEGTEGTYGTVICEQIKLIDPKARGCARTDRLSYGQMMNVSDAVQGMFEYD